MSVVVTLETVTAHPDGSYSIRYANGITQEFDSLDSIRDYVAQMENTETVMQMALARGLNVGNDFAQPNVVEGKTFTLDTGANNMLRIT